jgi:hypothetical protein
MAALGRPHASLPDDLLSLQYIWFCRWNRISSSAATMHLAQYRTNDLDIHFLGS